MREFWFWENKGCHEFKPKIKTVQPVKKVDDCEFLDIRVQL